MPRNNRNGKAPRLRRRSIDSKSGGYRGVWQKMYGRRSQVGTGATAAAGFITEGLPAARDFTF